MRSAHLRTFHLRASLLIGMALIAACSAAKSSEKAAGPATANANAYTRLTVASDPDPTGIFDPYLAADGAQEWLAYSGVTYQSSGGNLVADVQTNIARSGDAGGSWTFVQTAAPPQTGFTVTAPTSLCGASTCTGHLIAEVPFLIDDPSDPDPSKEWKLFEHRYFLYPPGQAGGTAIQYTLGAIFLQTAPSPDGTWTAGTPLLGWDATPPELSPSTNVQTLGASLAPCEVITEGAGLASNGVLYLAFACVYPSGGSNLQKIVLLRSTDHAATFTAVGDVLETADAASLGGTMPTAPALAMDGATPVLLVTPVSNTVTDNGYDGCATVAFADLASGTVERNGSVPAWREILPLQSGTVFGGACSFAGGDAADGILMAQLQDAGSPSDPFRIFASHALP